MTKESNNWIDGIVKLIELTQEGKLLWQVVHPDNSMKENPDDVIRVAFRAKYNDKRFRLYERASKEYFPVNPYDPLEGQEAYWSRKIVLEFEDRMNLPLWTYPDVDALNDLLSAVQFQVSGAKDFLNDILEESDY